ncbi:MAG: hypothetical protein HYW48_01185 [Deltaproteobacteria bacterium]|nr:hypothetical protein [Deltaproteobacteria bacterium]
MQVKNDSTHGDSFDIWQGGGLEETAQLVPPKIFMGKTFAFKFRIFTLY